MIEALAGIRRAYIDSNIFIYLLEGREPFQGLAEQVVTVSVENGVALVSSELCFAECLYVAAKAGNRKLEESYRRLLTSGEIVTLVPLALTVLEAAAKLGGRTGLKLMDSIHMATAQQMDCDAYITNDKRFRSQAGLQVIQLSE
jgi:predicted nucleic acid-binding protein